MSKARWLLLCTYLSASVNGSVNVSGPYKDGNANGAYSTLNSIFSSSPCTCMKGTSWTNFNVKVGGINHYSNAIQYSYEQYMMEMRQMGINGGLVSGLSSGLISASDFDSGSYGFVFVDLSRKLDIATDLANKSIEIVGTNNTNATVDIICFIGYEKSFKIDVFSGKLII